MLLDRRRALLTAGMAGMQVAWFTAFALLALPAVARASVLATFAALWAVVLLWLLLLDTLNRRHVVSPWYELAVAVLVIASTLLTLRVLVYGGSRPPFDLTWAGALARTVFDLAPGAGQILAVIVINVILWQRATAATGREVTFFGVGFSFRLGLLLMIIGGALLELAAGVAATPLLWCFFGFGLLSVALARIEDKAHGTASRGTPLPRTRLAQLGLAVGVTVALAAAGARLYTRPNIQAVFAWLAPLWRVLDAVGNVLLIVLGWLLTPVMIVLQFLLRKLLAGGFLDALRQLAAQLAATTGQAAPDQNTRALPLPAWVGTGLRYGAVLLVLSLLLGFVLLYLQRLGPAPEDEGSEAEDAEAATISAGPLAAALRRLAGLAGLARRYGLSRQLLAAVSVQNIYANLTRLARRRGYPRRPAQPPDDYLPALCRAFAGEEAALARITAAYMRVHYGDRPVTGAELAGLRADYLRVRRRGRPLDKSPAWRDHSA